MTTDITILSSSREQLTLLTTEGSQEHCLSTSLSLDGNRIWFEPYFFSFLFFSRRTKKLFWNFLVKWVVYTIIHQAAMRGQSGSLPLTRLLLRNLLNAWNLHFFGIPTSSSLHPVNSISKSNVFYTFTFFLPPLSKKAFYAKFPR